MKTGIIQQSNTANIEDNLSRLQSKIRLLADEGAELVILQELHNGLYFCQTEDVAVFDQAETIPGQSSEFFGKLARETGLVIVLSLFEKRAAGLYHNTAVVIEKDGSIAGKYRKMHIPDDPAYYEKFYFTPGDLGFKAFKTKFGAVAPLICWDQWYPEGARLATLQGAMALLYPTAIGWHPHEKTQYGQAQYNAWLTVQRGHAVANGVYVAAANRVGFEPYEGQAGIEFWGASFIADPQGIILAQASHDKEEVLLAEIDPGHLEVIRRNWPFLRDRRIDAYGGITKRFLDEEQDADV